MNATRTDVAGLKARVSLLDLLARDGYLARRAGANHVCRCPLHDEETGSFTIFADGGFKCFGCGTAGDVLDYIRLRDGCDFRAAVAPLEGLAGGTAPMIRPADTAQLTVRDAAALDMLYKLSNAELCRAVNAAETLLRDDGLTRRIAEARRWKPATIRGLALEPSLGWEEGKLAFLYDSGMKVRWREKGERRFAFACGKAQTLWRAALVVQATRKIYVCEGETDAISLVDAGVEGEGVETVVVALPGASIIRANWATVFFRREAILCFDADEAGQRAVKKFAEMIAPHAAKVSRLNWNRMEAA